MKQSKMSKKEMLDSMEMPENSGEEEMFAMEEGDLEEAPSEEMPVEEMEGPNMEEFSDEDLIAEMEKRGYSVPEKSEGEDMPEEEMPMPEEESEEEYA